MIHKTNRPRCSVIGSDGLIGRALFDQMGKLGVRVKGTTRRTVDSSSQYHLDLNRPTIPASVLYETDVAYICAGNTSISECETHKKETRQLNVDALTKVITECLNHDVFIVFLSTDMVFDGTKPSPTTADEPNPINEYARQKRDVEQFLNPHLGRAAIVRLSKVLYPEYPLFRLWLDQLHSGSTIFPFADKRIAPVFVDFALQVLMEIGIKKQPGLWHLSAHTDISYAQAIFYLADKYGLNPGLIQPVESKDMHTGAHRKHVALNCDRIEKLGFAVPHALDAIDRSFTSDFTPMLQQWGSFLLTEAIQDFGK